jgi:hypothetical protein
MVLAIYPETSVFERFGSNPRISVGCFKSPLAASVLVLVLESSVTIELGIVGILLLKLLLATWW